MKGDIMKDFGSVVFADWVDYGEDQFIIEIFASRKGAILFQYQVEETITES